MKILVVAAHPDDEILGIGGTICKHIASGDDVYVCIVTKAYEPQWPKEYMQRKVLEQSQVDEFWGVTKRYNLDLPTIRLNTLASGDLNSRVTEVVNSVEPDVIYTHFDGDLNCDHGLVFNACMVATRPPRRIRLLCFETLSETEWSDTSFLPNFWVNIDGFLDNKIKAFELYESEVREYPHPRSCEGVRILARKRGMEVCTIAAEAFRVVRSYWD